MLWQGAEILAKEERIFDAKSQAGDDFSEGGGLHNARPSAAFRLPDAREGAQGPTPQIIDQEESKPTRNMAIVAPSRSCGK